MKYTKFNITLDRKKNYHNHANYNNHSAPDLTIPNVVRRCEELGMTEYAFTEHVRKSSDWEDEYIKEIEKANAQSDVTVLIGFEAKVLSKKGDIDIKPELAQKYLVIGSFHTFHPVEDFFEALLNLTKNPDVDIIGHMGLCNDDVIELTEEQEDLLISSIIENDKAIDINSKHKLPTQHMIKKLIKRGARLCYGSDSHALDEVGRITYDVEE